MDPRYAHIHSAHRGATPLRPAHREPLASTPSSLQRTAAESMLPVRRLVVALAVLLLQYLWWWHVVFALMLWPIDKALYRLYVSQFLFGRGLEMPSFIQLSALVLAVASSIALSYVWLRRVKRRPAEMHA